MKGEARQRHSTLSQDQQTPCRSHQLYNIFHPGESTGCFREFMLPAMASYFFNWKYLPHEVTISSQSIVRITPAYYILREFRIQTRPRLSSWFLAQVSSSELNRCNFQLDTSISQPHGGSVAQRRCLFWSKFSPEKKTWKKETGQPNLLGPKLKVLIHCEVEMASVPTSGQLSEQ